MGINTIRAQSEARVNRIAPIPLEEVSVRKNPRRGRKNEITESDQVAAEARLEITLAKGQTYDIPTRKGKVSITIDELIDKECPLDGKQRFTYYPTLEENRNRIISKYSADKQCLLAWLEEAARRYSELR